MFTNCVVIFERNRQNNHVENTTTVTVPDKNRPWMLKLAGGSLMRNGAFPLSPSVSPLETHY